MDPFVRKLVLRLFDEGAPLSRNRHFHTFDTPEGKQAMKISRRLRALQQDIEKAGPEGVRLSPAGDGSRLELRLQQVRSTRTTLLDAAELDLLCLLPGVRRALGR